MSEETGHVWTYRGHPLRQMEWGLWKDLDQPGHYFLCYRPEGRNGPVIRRWAYADGVRLAVWHLQSHVDTVRTGAHRPYDTSAHRPA